MKSITKRLLTIASASLLLLSVSASSASAKSHHRIHHVTATRFAKVYCHYELRRHHVVKRHRRRQIRPNAYRYGLKAGRLQITNPIRESRLAAQHNREFIKGYYKTALRSYEDTVWSPLDNFDNQNNQRHIKKNTVKYRRDMRILRRSEREGLQSLIKYGHSNSHFQDGWDVANGDPSIKHEPNHSFKAGFVAGIHYYFGSNVSKRAMKSYYSNPHAIDEDMN